MDQNPPLTIVHYCGEWNEMDSMFFSSFEKLRLTSDVILLLLDCYQSHPSLETIQVEYLNNLIDNNTFLMIGCVSSDENQFSKCEESYLTSFICDPSNAFLTYFTKQFENNKLNGYLFLTQSNNNQLFEILMQHFENLIEEYIQNNHFEIWIRHNNLKRLLKHLLLSLILLSKLQQGRPSNSLLMRPQERTWLNQLCQSKQHDSMWNNLFEKMNHFLEQVEWNHQERIQKFNSLLNSSQPTTTTRTTTTSSNRFRVSKL
ncbi:hypothetical protein FDP41_002064 [Naegleria fowleri]|uniref:Uncharacterized protein n=1 Tax=Naegleria fowleri TaxID=5763 RepID=A0A6A5BXE5_NAEFO|nr:uncharacterized protein FDP41_002064 [Naegleria fowleri]KAF0978994.1 hypothetical protein FDP41_002064 [Naegleria fowleri]